MTDTFSFSRTNEGDILNLGAYLSWLHGLGWADPLLHASVSLSVR